MFFLFLFFFLFTQTYISYLDLYIQEFSLYGVFYFTVATVWAPCKNRPSALLLVVRGDQWSNLLAVGYDPCEGEDGILVLDLGTWGTKYFGNTVLWPLFPLDGRSDGPGLTNRPVMLSPGV